MRHLIRATLIDDTTASHTEPNEERGKGCADLLIEHCPEVTAVDVIEIVTTDVVYRRERSR